MTASASAPSPENAVLDEKALAVLRDLDPGGQGGLLERIMATFDSTLVRMLGQVETAHRQGDCTELGNVAHTLKSSSASIGALELSRLCVQIEKLVRDGRSAEVPPLVAPWVAQMHRVREAIRPLMGTPAC